MKSRPAWQLGKGLDVVIRDGSIMGISMDDLRYSNFDPAYYDSEWFRSNLHTSSTDEPEEGHGISFYDIRVEHTGNTYTVPLPGPGRL